MTNIEVEEDSIKVSLEPRISTGQQKRILPERKLKVDLVMYSGGRDANSEGLGCENLGINITKYGRIVVDDLCRTTSKHNIFAVGDVIGPPGLASAAQQQVFTHLAISIRAFILTTIHILMIDISIRSFNTPIYYVNL